METRTTDRPVLFSRRFNLNSQEREVLIPVVNSEASLQSIAKDMGLSSRTLQRRLTSIYLKTNVSGRIGLTALYWKLG